MIVYLIRHGQTDYNKKTMLQGGTDIALNDYGRQLAREAAKRMKDVPFDLAITSPLWRAKETAQIILGDRAVPLTEDARIREISFGEYEGLSYNNECFTVPDRSFLNFFEAPQEYKVPPKGESFASILERTGEFWQDIIDREEYREKTILVSTHGCALNAILTNIRKASLKDFWGSGLVKNCEAVKVTVNGDCVQIEEGE